MSLSATVQKMRPATWRCLGSLAVLPSERDGQHLVPEGLSDFVRRWDHWYRGFLVEEGRLDLLYHRAVTIEGEFELERAVEFEPLGRACEETGLALGSMVRAESLVSAARRGWAWLESSGIKSLAVAYERAVEVDEFTVAIKEVIARKVQVTLTGDILALVERGVLDDEVISGQHLHMRRMPSSTDPPRPEVMRACHDRIRLIVDPEGRLYPCFALVGVPKAELGTIDLDFPGAPLSDPATRETLRRMAQEGPLDEELSSALDTWSLGSPCAEHRAWLEGSPKEWSGTHE